MHFIELDFVAFMAIVFALYWGFQVLAAPAVRGVVERTLRALGSSPAQAEAIVPDLPRVLVRLTQNTLVHLNLLVLPFVIAARGRRHV